MKSKTRSVKKNATSTKDKVTSRNRKVASLRGDAWKKNLKAGKLAAQLRPSKLKIHRVKKNLSQTDIALKANVSLSTYGGIERATRPTSERVARQISNLLGARANLLFSKNKAGKFIASV